MKIIIDETRLNANDAKPGFYIDECGTYLIKTHAKKDGYPEWISIEGTYDMTPSIVQKVIIGGKS